MDLSIIISNYDPKGQLVPCIDHALAQELEGGGFEVLFPLHGPVSSEELAQLRARASASGRLWLLDGENGNRARALNLAVREAKSDCLLFLESHVAAPPDLGAHCLRRLRGSGVAAVQGAFEAGGEGGWVSQTETRLRNQSCRLRRARGLQPDEFHLHSAGFMRDAIIAAGGFDERFPGIAEVPLLQRIEEGGGRIMPLMTPAARHLNHDDLGEYASALRRRGREVGRLWRLDPFRAAVLYPSAALGRCGPLVRATRLPLLLAAEALLAVLSGVVAATAAMGLRQLTLPVASKLASTAVRAGVLEGYGG
jgi:glycosyltransferase involved in cell wall biosynthesis